MAVLRLLAGSGGVLLSLLFSLHAGEPASKDSHGGFRFAGGERVTVLLKGGDFQIVLDQVVTSDGFISAPASGAVNVLGMSIQEATDAVAQRVSSKMGLTEPLLSVAVTSIPPRWVYVLGEVDKPMGIEMPQNQPLYLAGALARAGGLTKDADGSRIKLVREQGRGKKAVETVDGSAFGKEDRDDLGPVLESGDTVLVPRDEFFSVIGEVNKPAVISRKETGVPAGEPIRLSVALAAAGGLKNMADKKAVRLVRTDEKGRRTVNKYNFESALENGDLRQDPILKEGDQILVVASEGVQILGRVRSPGIYFQVGAPLTVSRLISLAGGFDQYAKKTVLVVKKGTPGQPLEVDMKALLELGKGSDVLLSPGDVVFVPESGF